MPLYQADPFKILFLDIETVSEHADFQKLSEPWQELWADKTRFLRKEETPEDYYPQRAAIMAEFGKVVCISCGYFVKEKDEKRFRVKSFAGENEFKSLNDFAKMLRLHFDRNYKLCAHNGKEFDFPYLARRMIVHEIKLPKLLNFSGLKPWQVPHLDTMEMWKFGDWKSFTSLKLLAELFGLPTPKDDIDGSQVGDVFWKENDINRIRDYCQKDVVTLARIFLRMENRGELKDEEIIFNDEN